MFKLAYTKAIVLTFSFSAVFIGTIMAGTDALSTEGFIALFTGIAGSIYCAD